MKKIKFEKKLSLNKESIVKLNNNQLTNVKGGDTNTATCPTYVATACTTSLYCVSQSNGSGSRPCSGEC
jgi:natural product precursor